jgi:hypothetical protein
MTKLSFLLFGPLGPLVSPPSASKKAMKFVSKNRFRSEYSAAFTRKTSWLS